MPRGIQKSRFYPYTIHFGLDTEPELDRESFSFTREGVFIDGKLQSRLQAHHIEELKACMLSLLEEALTYNHVATFAVGGVFPLNFMARFLEEAGPSMEEGKFHLLAGLNWRVTDFDPKERLLSWLDSLHEGHRVLLFDTGNEGNAGGQLRNLIEAHYRNEPAKDLEISIRIIATRRAKKDKPTTVFRGKNGKTARVDLRFLWVADNPFEDEVHFVGYESLRTKGMMKAHKSLGGRILDFGTHANAVLSADIGEAFMSLFLGGRMRLLRSIGSLDESTPESWPPLTELRSER